MNFPGQAVAFFDQSQLPFRQLSLSVLGDVPDHGDYVLALDNLAGRVLVANLDSGS